ncbi:MAG: glycosyltransferase [candidate division WOR-3 bacterium]
MKKILFLCELLPFHTIAGRPWFLAQALKKKGVIPIFFGLSPNPLKYFSEKKYNPQKFWEIFKINRYYKDDFKFFSLPRYLPLRYVGLHKFYNSFILPQLFFLKFKHLCEEAIIYTQNPIWFWVIKKLKKQIIIYDRIDDLKVFFPLPETKNFFEKVEKELLTKTTIIFSICKNIEENLKKKYSKTKIVHLPNAVPQEWYEIINKKIDNSILFPSQNFYFKRPIIGFVGSLFWWIDFNLIEKCLQEFPQATFLFIGPYKEDIKRLLKYKNLFLLGPRPYSLIPYYINFFDICILPFKKDEVAYNSDPIKIYEYLALGKPVVSTPIGTSDDNLDELVYFARTDEEFIVNINKALKENNQFLQEKRREYIFQNHTWEKRAETFIKVISSF